MFTDDLLIFVNIRGNIEYILEEILGEYYEGKKERYIDKWRKEHPRVQFYLSKEEYNTIKKIAEEKGITIKDLILESIKGK
jgi:hypothetical protein